MKDRGMVSLFYKTLLAGLKEGSQIITFSMEKRPSGGYHWRNGSMPDFQLKRNLLILGVEYYNTNG